MKKIISYFLFYIASIAFVTTLTAQTNCNPKEMKKHAVNQLSPYHYSSSKITNVGSDNVLEEIEIQLLKGEKYKLVFNTAELSDAIVVEIYDKPNDNEKRKLVFSSKDQTNKMFAFEPEKSKNIYLNYRISSPKTETKKGCVTFVLGYLLDF